MQPRIEPRKLRSGKVYDPQASTSKAKEVRPPRPPRPRHQPPMAEQGEDIPNVLPGVPAPPQVAQNNQDERTIGDYTFPSLTGVQSPINYPAVNANNFEIKPGFLALFTNKTFSGTPNENPHHHLNSFNQILNTIKMNGMSRDNLSLRIFPFTLEGRAHEWFWSHAPGSFTTWEGLAQAFLSQYFPPGLTGQYRAKIANFSQLSGESLYEAWERFKALIRGCPHHGLQKWLVIQSFYNGLDYNMRAMIDQGAGGSLMEVKAEEAEKVIERLASNAHRWASERSNPKRNTGGHQTAFAMEENEAVTLLSKKIDSLFSVIQSQGTGAQGMSVVDSSCDICPYSGHSTSNCPMTMPLSQGMQTEDVNYMGRNVGAFGSSSNPTYTPNNRNHPNLSYKTQEPVPPGFQPKQGMQFNSQGGQQRPFQPQQFYQKNQNYGQNSYTANQYRPPQQGQGQTSDSKGIESMLAEILARQEKTDNQLNKLAEVTLELNTRNKLLETQVAQQASAMQRQLGKLPSKTEEKGNPSCSAITTRSGVTIEPRMTKKKVTFAAHEPEQIPAEAEPQENPDTDQEKEKDP